MLHEEFFGLFAGLSRAHGEYIVHARKPGDPPKVKGRARTIQENVTSELWKAHLEGTTGIGVVPITDEATVRFAVIDVDKYENLDLYQLEKEIKTRKFPLVVVRSKSGGAHLYLFFKEDAPAHLARSKLNVMARALGYGSSEIFPKQDRLDRSTDTGNWINMPYFDAERTVRYAIADGKALRAEEFIEHAKNRAITVQQLRKLEIIEIERLAGAPPCLQQMERDGVGEGSRNEALFQFGVYCRLRWPEEWEQKLIEANNEVMLPPVGINELNVIAKQLNKKTYFYRCNAQPMASMCDKQACLQQTYGVGTEETESDYEIVVDTVKKITWDKDTSATWVFSINGEDVRMSTAQVLSQRQFQTMMLDRFNICPRTLSAGKWRNQINSWCQGADHEQAPDDATPAGELLHHLDTFVTQRQTARNRDELLNQMAYHDEEAQLVYFKGPDFKTYLGNQQFRRMTMPQVWTTLRERCDARNTRMNIKGKVISVWEIDAGFFSEQTESLDVPQLPEEDL